MGIVEAVSKSRNEINAVCQESSVNREDLSTCDHPPRQPPRPDSTAARVFGARFAPGAQPVHLDLPICPLVLVKHTLFCRWCAAPGLWIVPPRLLRAGRVREEGQCAP